MDIFEAYEMSEPAVRDGVWAELSLFGETIGRIRVRPNDPDLNSEYRAGLAAMGEGIRAIKVEHGELTEERAIRLTAGLYADTIVTDFELYTAGIGANKGKEVRIKYSVKKTIELLCKLPKLMTATTQAARQWTKFRKVIEDDAVKS